MVRFDPTISYSDEASEIFSEYRKLKDKQEKKEKDRLSEPIGYATLKLDLLTEDMKERVEAFISMILNMAERLSRANITENI